MAQVTPDTRLVRHDGWGVSRLRQFVLFVHLFAAVFWIGEMLFVGFVLGPVSRGLPALQRSTLFRAVGRASLPLAWTAIGLLVVTGILNLVLMGIPLGSLLTPSFYRTGFGMWLGIKLLAVVAMLVLSALHDFHVGRRANAVRREIQAAGGAAPEELVREAERYRRIAMRIGIANVVLAIVVLAAAAGLVAGS